MRVKLGTFPCAAASCLVAATAAARTLTITVRVGGEFGARHGDTVYLTPDPAKIHRFDAAGLRIE